MGNDKITWAGAGRWVRDHFSNWFANSFVMVGVFAIIMASIIVGMYFDGQYARRWSPDKSATNIFTGYGWLISLAMVFFTAAGIKAIQDGARLAGGVMFLLGLYFTVLSATQSVGVVTLKAQTMMAQDDAFKKVEAADTNRLEFLRSEREDLMRTRDSEIARIQSSIDAIEDDAIDGIPAGDQRSIDQFNARIDTLRNEADTKIAAIGDEIKAELATPEGSGEPIAAAPARFDAGIEFWSYVFHGHGASDDEKESLTYWYMLFWSIGCPLMGQMLAVYLVITRRTSQEAAKATKAAEAARKGWETRREREDRESRDARRMGKLIEGAKYFEDVARALVDAKERRPALVLGGMIGVKKYHTSGIRSVPELIGILDQCLKYGSLTRDEYDKLVGTPAVNGHDTTSEPQGGDDANDEQRPSSNQAV